MILNRSCKYFTDLITYIIKGHRFRKVIFAATSQVRASAIFFFLLIVDLKKIRYWGGDQCNGVHARLRKKVSPGSTFEKGDTDSNAVS
jgi:hypothetical protein